MLGRKRIELLSWRLWPAVLFPHLALSNHVHKFNSSNRRRSGSKTFEPKFSGNELLVFNIFDWKERTYLKHDLMVEKCRDLGLTPIPVAFREDSFNKSMEDLLELARGKYDKTDNNREGIVLRSAEQDGSFVSFKVLNNDFLLAYDAKPTSPPTLRSPLTEISFP